MKPEDIKLADEEINRAWLEAQDIKGDEQKSIRFYNAAPRHRAIAQAQLKKVVGHINPRLTPHYKEGEQDGWYMPCWFWEQIKKIAGVE